VSRNRGGFTDNRRGEKRKESQGAAPRSQLWGKQNRREGKPLAKNPKGEKMVSPFTEMKGASSQRP